MIVRFIFAIVALSWLGLEPAQGQDVNPSGKGIEGVWVTADGDGWVEIRRDGELFHGTILGGPNDDDRKDTENPDPKLRDRPLTGLRILSGLRPAGSGKWDGGEIYDPNNGKTYRCNVELESDKTLKVRGFIGVSLFGRTERWTRKGTS